MSAVCTVQHWHQVWAIPDLWNTSYPLWVRTLKNEGDKFRWINNPFTPYGSEKYLNLIARKDLKRRAADQWYNIENDNFVMYLIQIE